MNDATQIVAAPIKPPPRFRRTRIAVSVFFGLLTIALCVMWWRSYSWNDGIAVDGNLKVSNLTSSFGLVGCTNISNFPSLLLSGWWIGWSERITDPDPIFDPYYWKFHFEVSAVARTVLVPYWFLVALCGTPAAILGVPLCRQFSLRTMLIATTLVAVVLGLGVWAGG